EGRGGAWAGGSAHPESGEEEEKRATVHRASKLPKELPAWFRQIDTDGDAQIGLYEWKTSGRAIEEFVRMDRNGDGFLTVDEVLYYEAKRNGGAGSTVVAAAPGGLPSGFGGSQSMGYPAGVPSAYGSPGAGAGAWQRPGAADGSSNPAWGSGGPNRGGPNRRGGPDAGGYTKKGGPDGYSKKGGPDGFTKK